MRKFCRKEREISKVYNRKLPLCYQENSIINTLANKQTNKQTYTQTNKKAEKQTNK